MLRSLPGEPPYPETMNRRRDRRDRGARPRRRPREGRPHEPRHRRGVRRLPRRVRAARRPDAPRARQPRRDARRVDGARGRAVRGRRRRRRRSRCSTPCSRASSGARSPPTQLALARRARAARRPGRCSCSATTTCGTSTRPTRSAEYFGINPDDSEAFGAVVAARENIVGYFAGHTHRNRVRRSDAGPPRAVRRGRAATKDYPGVWAEYRIYEHGYTQVVRRISAPAALAWTERTRPMFAGLYRAYALGRLDHRCFTETSTFGVVGTSRVTPEGVRARAARWPSKIARSAQRTATASPIRTTSGTGRAARSRGRRAARRGCG